MNGETYITQLQSTNAAHPCVFHLSEYKTGGALYPVDMQHLGPHAARKGQSKGEKEERSRAGREIRLFTVPGWMG